MCAWGRGLLVKRTGTIRKAFGHLNLGVLRRTDFRERLDPFDLVRFPKTVSTP
jgi:hypothetical protein